MKVLFLVHQFYPEYYTGTEKFVFKMASMAQRTGHSVRVATYGFGLDPFCDNKRGNILWKNYTYKGIPVTALKHNSLPETRDITLSDEGISSIAEYIFSREKPDVIHAGHLMRMQGFINVARRLNIPYLLTLTDFWIICPRVTLINSRGDICKGPGEKGSCPASCPELPREFMASRFEEAFSILSDARKVVSPSFFLGSFFKKIMEPLDVTIINHGMSYASIRKNTKRYEKGSPVVFCYAGSLNRHKGIHVLIQAFKTLPSAKITLKIYGSGPDTVYIDKLYKMAESDSRIEFCGVYSEEGSGDIFTAIDVAVVPSLWYENYPLVLHEALACSVPVVASNIGGMAEKIRNGDNGFTFPVGDAEGLAEVLGRIADNPEILNALKENMKGFILPSIEQEALAYQVLYEGMKST